MLIGYRTRFSKEGAKLKLEFFMEYIRELSRLLGTRMLEYIMEFAKIATEHYANLHKPKKNAS